MEPGQQSAPEGDLETLAREHYDKFLGTPEAAQLLNNPDDPAANLMVNFLDPNLSEDEIRNSFEPHGQIVSFKLIKDKTTGNRLGYGFVKYSNATDASKAIQALHGTKMGNKTLRVAVAQPDGVTFSKIYIAGIPISWTNDDLKRVFGVVGPIQDANLLTGETFLSFQWGLDSVSHLLHVSDKETHQSRGAGFVRFSTRSQADTAIGAFNGTSWPGGSKPIIVKFADNQGQRGAKTPTPTPGTGRNQGQVSSSFFSYFH